MILEKAFQLKYLNYLPFVFGAGLKTARPSGGSLGSSKEIRPGWGSSLLQIVLEDLLGQASYERYFSSLVLS